MPLLTTAAYCAGYTAGCFTGAMITSISHNRNRVEKLKNVNLTGAVFGTCASVMVGVPTTIACNLLFSTPHFLPKLSALGITILLNHIGVTIFHNDDINAGKE